MLNKLASFYKEFSKERFAVLFLVACIVFMVFAVVVVNKEITLRKEILQISSENIIYKQENAKTAKELLDTKVYLTKLRDSFITLQERDLSNEFTSKLLVKLANNVSDIYHIRNEILYNSKVGEIPISLETASYQATWIYLCALEFNLDPLLLSSVGIQETGLQHNRKDGTVIINGKSAVGMFQITPIVSGMYFIDPTLFEENVHTGAKFLARQLKRYGKLDYALAHYNAGSRVKTALKEFPETITYVSNVQKYYKILTDKYRNKE